MLDAVYAMLTHIFLYSLVVHENTVFCCSVTLLLAADTLDYMRLEALRVEVGYRLCEGLPFMLEPLCATKTHPQKWFPMHRRLLILPNVAS